MYDPADNPYERSGEGKRHLPSWRCLRRRQANSDACASRNAHPLDSEHLQEHLALIRAVELGQYHALPLAQHQCAPIDRY